MAFSFSFSVFVLVTGCVSGTPEQHLKAGAERFQRGDTASAIREFKDALRLDKEFAPAYYNLGVCYSTPKTRNKAIEQFNRAIQCDPRYADAYIALGQAYISKDTLNAAVAVLKRGLELGVTPAAFYQNLGYCYMRKSSKDTAIAYYQQAIAQDPADANNYFNVGYMLGGQHADSSIKYLRLAYGHAANKSAVSFLLGMRLLDKRQRSAAETKEGIAMLEDYLAHGDHEAMKTDQAHQKLASVRLEQ